MKTFAVKWPELFWPLGLWAFGLTFSWLPSKIDGPPYSLATFLVILVHLAAFSLTCFLVGKPNDASFDTYVGGSSSQTKLPRWAGVAFILTIAAFLVMLLAYFQIRKDLIGVGSAETRELRKSIEGNIHVARLYDVMSPLALASAYFCMRWNPMRKSALAYYVIVCMAFAGTMILSGARYEIVPVLLVLVASVLTYHGQFILKYLLRTALLAVGAFLFAAVMNVVLNLASFRGGSMSHESYMIEVRGAAILSSLGVENPPSGASMFVALVDEYLLQPPRYFDYYREVNNLPTARGGHQFSTLAYRFKIRDGIDIKEDVDLLYQDLGIERNVWATGIREMWIDFGFPGSAFAFAFFGFCMGISKRYLQGMFTAQFAHSYFFAYFLFSPFSSILKATNMQAGFYGVFLLFGIEYVLTNGGRRRLLIGPAPTQ